MDGPTNLSFTSTTDVSPSLKALAELRKAIESIDKMSPRAAWAKELSGGVRSALTEVESALGSMQKTMDAQGAALAAKSRASGKAAGKALADGLSSASADVDKAAKDLANAQAQAMVQAVSRTEKAQRDSIKQGQRFYDLRAQAQHKAEMESIQMGRIFSKLRAQAQHKESQERLKAQYKAEMESVQMGHIFTNLRVKAALDEAAEGRKRMLSTLKTQAKAMWSEVGATEKAASAEVASDRSALLRGIKAQTKLLWGDINETQRAQALAMQKASSIQQKALDADLVFFKNVMNLKVAAANRAAAEMAKINLGRVASSASAQVNNEITKTQAPYSIWTPGRSNTRGVVVDRGASLQAEAADGATRKALSAENKEAIAQLKTLNDSKKTFIQTLKSGHKPLVDTTKHMNDLHSAARGVASGFNAMWLTWGNIVPLLAGAAVSNAFVQTVRSGSEFETIVAKIGYLGGTSATALSALSSEALKLGSTSQYGPIEVANGLKTLTLAGLDANEALQALRPTMDFATVAEMPLDKAAESLIGISKAFGYTASEMSIVGDVIAKTAASTMSSVTDMTEAFKQSSTIAQSFGVSIKDQSLVLGLLSQIGVKGSAAGTSVRNMYVELMGSSKKARAILESTLKVDIFDNVTKAVKPLPVIFEQLSQSLSNMKPDAQLKVLNALGNERGLKALSATLRSLVEETQATGGDIVKVFDDLKAKLDESYGFVAKAAAGMSVTSENMMKTAGNALQTSLIKAFDELQPTIAKVSLALRDFFNSREFIDGLKGAAETLVSFGAAIYRNIDIITGAVGAYTAYRLAVFEFSALMIALPPILNTAALAVIAFGGSLKTAATIAGSTPLIAALAVGLTALAAAYTYLSDEQDKAAQAAESAELKTVRAAQEGLKLNGMKVAQMTESIRKDNERIAALLKNSGDQIKATQEVRAAEVDAAAAKLKTDAEINASHKRRQAEALKTHAAELLAASDPNKWDESGLKALALRAEANDLIQEANREVSHAESEGIKLRREIAKNVSLSKRLDAQATERIANSRRSMPSGNADFNPDDRTNSGKDRAKTLQLKLDNELQQVMKRYADEVSTIKGFEKNEQDLLRARYDAKLVTAGEYQARELALAEKSEREQLAAADAAGEAYSAAALKRAAEIQRQYEEALAANESARGLDPKKRLEADKASAEAFKKAMVDLGNEGVTTWEKINNDKKSITDNAFTRTTLAAIRARGEVKALDDAAREFWVSERLRTQAAARATDVEDALRYASPEQAAYIQAAATESDRQRAIMADLTKQYVAAREALNGYTASMLDAEEVSDAMRQGETDRIDALKRLKKQMDDVANSAPGAVVDAGAAAMLKLQKDQYAEFVKGIAGALETALYEGGKAGRKKLRDLIVAELRKPITLAINAVVQAIMQPVAGSITNAMGLGGVGGVGNAASLYNAGSSVASWLGLGASAGTGLAATAGSGLGLAASTGGGLGLSATAGAGLGLAASTGGGLGLSASSAGAASMGAGSAASGLMAAAPWLLGGVAVLSLLKSLDDSGTMHTGGLAQWSAAGGTQTSTEHGKFGMGFGGVDYGEAGTTFATSMAKTTGGMLDSVAVTFGKKAGYTIAAAFADDTSKDNSWGGLLIKDQSGSTVVNWDDSRTSKWAPREFADGATGGAQYAAAVAKDVRDYLVTQAPQWADDALNALGDSVTLDQLGATVDLINNAAVAFDTMGRASAQFGNLSEAATAALVTAMGGVQAAISGLGSYYTNFYSDTERAGVVRGQLQDKFTGMGLGTLPKTREEFRAVVESLDLTTESGRAMYAELIKLSPAFASVTAAVVDTVAAAADATEAANKALAAAKTAAYNQLAASVARDRAALELQVTAATSLRDEVQAVFDTLTTSIRELRAEALGSTLSAAQGQAFITSAIAAAQSGLGLPDGTELSAAISAARGGITAAGAYGNSTEREFAALKLAGDLSLLQASAGEQLTTAELQLQAANEQITQLDDTLAYWKKLIDGTDEGIDATMSVAAAVDKLRLLMFPEAAAATVTSTSSAASFGAGTNANGGVLPAVTSNTTTNTDPAKLSVGYAYARNRLPDSLVNYAASIFGWDTASALGPNRTAYEDSIISEVNRYKQFGGNGYQGVLSGQVEAYNSLTTQLHAASVPGFAAGGLFGGGLRLVGEDGPELEVTGPARYYNAADTQRMLGGGGGGGDGGGSQVVALLRQIADRVAALEGHAENSANANTQTADVLTRASQGDALTTTAAPTIA